MRNKYKILRTIVIFEFILAFILSKFFELKITSIVLGIFVLIIFFAPILYWLYLISKDNNYSTIKRMICKFFIVFISSTIIVVILKEIIIRVFL